ncbi:DUF7576 family protein [Salinigranum sp. GCM10025319]|uniref:DUF7576 family protein n=1 Tax=Salinigranum sp. GCM10025319 TaxID=3252687 RepID=UPI003612A09D
MALSDYTGRTPRAESGLVVGRVSQHHLWTMDAERTARCPHCDSALDLQERHLLVTLSKESDYLPAGKRYLCDESCLESWLDEG